MKGALPKDDFVLDLVSLRSAEVPDICDDVFGFYYILSLFRLGHFRRFKVSLIELKVS